MDDLGIPSFMETSICTERASQRMCMWLQHQDFLGSSSIRFGHCRHYKDRFKKHLRLRSLEKSRVMATMLSWFVQKVSQVSQAIPFCGWCIPFPNNPAGSTWIDISPEVCLPGFYDSGIGGANDRKRQAQLIGSSGTIFAANLQYSIDCLVLSCFIYWTRFISMFFDTFSSHA
jgi:hypothetical protein